MIVVDASAVLEWLKWTAAGRALDDRIQRPGESIHAPHVIDLEVAQALSRWRQQTPLTEDDARASFEDFGSLVIHRYPHDILAPRIWALGGGLTAHEAAYAALAEALGAPLLTADPELADSLEGAGSSAAVEVLGPRAQ